MNGPEFFMRHAGYRLRPASRKTDDAVADANTLFSVSLPLNTGKTLRLSSCWMVVTPQWSATSFKAVAEAGFRPDMERKVAIEAALKSGEPCVLLAGAGQANHDRTRHFCHPRPACCTPVQRGRGQNLQRHPGENMDIVIDKPARVQGYALHRIVAQYCQGKSALWADEGAQV